MRTSRTVLLAMIIVPLGILGCQRGDSLDRKVSAGTASAFSAWRAHVASDSSRENRRRVDEALQEIRVKFAGERELKRVMGEPVVPGTESVDDAVRERVDGRPLREVLQLGCELRVRRLKEELAGLEDAMGKNAQLVTRPGDLESKHHLETLRERQLVRVEKYREDIAKAERELEPLLKVSGQLLITPATDKPDEMPARQKSAATNVRR
jgi:hypothetical protein